MRLFFSLIAAALPVTSLATEAPSLLDQWRAAPEMVISSPEVTLEPFKWLARPVVVFADSPSDPRFVEQMALLNAGLPELVERDVVVIVDTDPAAGSVLREELRPRGFMLALIGKDGTINLRKPLPWDVRELSRSIDKMPMRQQEMRLRPAK